MSESDLLVHDETNKMLATMLASMEPPALPVAMGILYCNEAPTYGDQVRHQAEQVSKASPAGDLNALLRGGRTWTVLA